MRDNFNNIWEALLKAAVLENTYHQMMDYPSIEKINEMELPRHYEMKMRKVIRHYQNKTKLKKLMKSAGRVASWLLVVVGIVFLFLLQFDEVRASCKNVVMKVYERFIQYDFKSSVSDKDIIEVGFVPEGYELESEEFKSDGMDIMYKNNLEDTVRISFFKDNRTIYLDNEHYLIRDVQINNLKGEFFEAQSESFKNYIIWSTQNGCVYIASSLDFDTMIKIAENIK